MQIALRGRGAAHFVAAGGLALVAACSSSSPDDNVSPGVLHDDLCRHRLERQLVSERDADRDSDAPTPTWSRVLDNTVVTGHSWTGSPGVTFTYTTMASMTVAAGTFSDCVSVDRHPGTITAYFCRGVGMVKQNVSFNGSKFDAELTAKNL